MSNTKTYKVLGIEGDVISVNDVEYKTGDTVDLTDEEAAVPLSESKVELVEATDAPVEATPEEAAPADAAPEEAPASGNIQPGANGIASDPTPIE